MPRTKKEQVVFNGTGRRKSSIARVRIMSGKGNITVNGEALDEPYLQPGIVTDLLGNGFDDFTVPENTVFAMGDNRTHSTDCRAFGCIPLEKIESTVSIRIWPLNVWGKEN